MSKIGLLGIGYSVPEKVLTNFDLEKMVDTTDEWITQRTGIKTRHIATDKECNSDIIVPGAQRAIQMAGIDPQEIDAIIVGTVTPDYMFPSTAAMVQKKLGIKEAMVFDFEAGCTGFLYGLDIARGLIATGNYRNVLAIGSDLLSKITNWKERNTCVLFGDGGRAAVIGTRDDAHELIDVKNYGDGTLGDLLIQPGGGSVNPISNAVIDNDLQYLQMGNGPEIFKWAILDMCKVSKELMDKHGLAPDEVDWLIPHQANLRIMVKVAERLNIPEEKVVITVPDYGNTSAGTIPIAMGRYLEDGRIKSGQTLLLTAFGAGFTYGAALIRW